MVFGKFEYRLWILPTGQAGSVVEFGFHASTSNAHRRYGESATRRMTDFPTDNRILQFALIEFRGTLGFRTRVANAWKMR